MATVYVFLAVNLEEQVGIRIGQSYQVDPEVFERTLNLDDQGFVTFTTNDGKVYIRQEKLIGLRLKRDSE